MRLAHALELFWPALSSTNRPRARAIPAGFGAWNGGAALHGINRSFTTCGHRVTIRRSKALLWPRALRRKDKDLAGINQVGIADLFPVRLVNDGVARARAVGVAAEAPKAVAAGDGGGHDLRHDHGGGRVSVWQNS